MHYVTDRQTDAVSPLYLVWCECLYVVEQWFPQLRTQCERITQLNGRQLQQHEE